MADDIQGLSRLLGRVKQLATDTRHLQRPLEAAGAYMLTSIEKNFREQGRPQKWKGLSERTRAGRRRGRGKGGAQILIDRGRLKNSIGFRVHGDDGVEVGTNVKYAKRQHFGYPGGKGRGHSRTPARPFLLMQGEDIREIGNIFRRHIER